MELTVPDAPRPVVFSLKNFAVFSLSIFVFSGGELIAVIDLL
jgi:hypothetical protein